MILFRVNFYALVDFWWYSFYGECDHPVAPLASILEPLWNH